MHFSLDKQIQWFSHHLPVVYTGGVVLLISLCVFAFLSTQSFIVVELDEDIDTSTLNTYVSTDAETTKTDKPTGLMLVSRKTKSIIVAKSDYVKTQVDVDIPWYGYIKKKVDFKEDQNATKVAFRSTTGAECMTYSKAFDQISYFDCRNPKVILKYNTPKNKSWSNSVVARVYYANGKAVPYMGGVIGIADFSESKTSSTRYSFVYTKPDGKIQTYNIPENMSTATSMQTIQLFTDTSDSSNEKFAVVDSTGTIYLGTPNGDSVTYATIQKPDKYNRDNNTFCSVHSDTVSCYRGKSPIGDIEDGVKTEPNADVAIETSKFDGSDHTVTKINSFNEPVDTFTEVNGIYYAKSFKKLFVFEKDTVYHARELAQNVDSIADNKALYYIQNKSIFTYDQASRSAHVVFHSPLLEPQSLLGADGLLFFTARTTQDKTITYAYKLDDTKNNANRLIDKFPVKVDGVYSMDLVSNRLSVTLSNVTRYSNTRQLVDQNKLSTAKNEFASKLNASGIDITQFEIEYIY